MDQMEQNHNTQKQNNGNKAVIIILCAIIVMLVLLLVGGYYAFVLQQESAQTEEEIIELSDYIGKAGEMLGQALPLETWTTQEEIARISLKEVVEGYTMLGVQCGMELEQAREIIEQSGYQETDVHTNQDYMIINYAKQTHVGHYTGIDAMVIAKQGRIMQIECMGTPIDWTETPILRDTEGEMEDIATDADVSYEREEVPEEAVEAIDQEEAVSLQESDEQENTSVESQEEGPETAFADMKVYVGNWYHPETLEGCNAAGEPINRCLYVEFSMDEQMKYRYQMSKVTCTWGHIINGEGRWEREADINTAKEGLTYMEFAVTDAENSLDGRAKYTYMIFLPDDPDIAGLQDITFKVGQEEKTITVELEYLGDYETGEGWWLLDYF